MRFFPRNWLLADMPSYRFSVLQQTLHLLPEKAIFWEEQRLLLVADVHLGKATHFRKHGIAVSGGIIEGDLARLGRIIESWEIEQLWFLGDLFHSDYNREWKRFESWLKGLCHSYPPHPGQS